MSVLFVVATPIGNLSDISERARDILCSVKIVVTEDTRVTRKLLNRIGSKAGTTSFNEHNSDRKLSILLSKLEKHDLAVVTDAGTPGISDPGPKLVLAANESGHIIQSVPGPSAVSAALSVSGFAANSYQFLGFLSRQKKRRIEQLRNTLNFRGPTVIFESPHRLLDTLNNISSVFETRQIVVCRELTKLHEELFRGTAEEAMIHFQRPMGEFVLILGPNTKKNIDPNSNRLILERLQHHIDHGLRGRDLVDTVVNETRFSKSRVYRLAMEITT